MSDTKPQSQASLTDQLRELIVLANQNGLYNAADWIKSKLEYERIPVWLDEALNSGNGTYRP